MGGKGRRRRERNYRAAHGGGSKSLLPPPPVLPKLDSLPSKLRTLISLSSSHHEQSLGRARKPGDGEDGAVATKPKADKRDARRENYPSLIAPPPHGATAGNDANHENQKKRKKRKRGEPVDLRFQSSIDLSEGSRRKERKKAHREARKKKQKKSNDQLDGDLPFPGQEKVEFGDVVKQPPRFANVPKAMKFFQDASKQRLRLQAIEAYRNRKGWVSRPGISPAPDVVSGIS